MSKYMQSSFAENVEKVLELVRYNDRHGEKFGYSNKLAIEHISKLFMYTFKQEAIKVVEEFKLSNEEYTKIKLTPSDVIQKPWAL